MVVLRIRVPVEKVVPVDVVNIAVAVVVNRVAWDFAGIPPHIGGEVCVRIVDAGIDDRDDHGFAAHGCVPRLRRIDIHIRRATRLSRVVQPPQAGIQRIVGRAQELLAIVGLGVTNPRCLVQTGQRRLHSHVFGKRHDRQPRNQLEFPLHRAAPNRLERLGSLRPGRDGGIEPHQQFPAAVFGILRQLCEIMRRCLQHGRRSNRT